MSDLKPNMLWLWWSSCYYWNNEVLSKWLYLAVRILMNILLAKTVYSVLWSNKTLFNNSVTRGTNKYRWKTIGGERVNKIFCIKFPFSSSGFVRFLWLIATVNIFICSLERHRTVFADAFDTTEFNYILLRPLPLESPIKRFLRKTQKINKSKIVMNIVDCH